MRDHGEPASKRKKKNTGDVFYRIVNAEDGRQRKVRGHEADAQLNETLLRMDYDDSDGDEVKGAVSEGEQGRRGSDGGREGREICDNEVDPSEYSNRLSRYDTLSCGYAADGSIRRLPKSLLRYSKKKLLDLLDEMFNPPLNKRRPSMSFKYR